jgi:hypothetical protein
MKCEDIQELIIEYIGGGLNDMDTRRVEEHLASCENCRAEVADMKSIWSKLENMEMEDPSDTLRRNFNNMIDSYSLGMDNNSRAPWHEMISKWLESWWPKRPLMQFATTVAVLIIGLATGLAVNQRAESKKEIAQLKTDMNQIQNVVMSSLLNQSSAADRINGLTMSGRLKEADDEFFSVLLLMLNSDSNVNVRLAAVNALANFSNNVYVRHELVKSLSLQSSPLVQISLIDLLASIRETGSSSTLIGIINDPYINAHVKERARKALKQFV